MTKKDERLLTITRQQNQEGELPQGMVLDVFLQHDSGILKKSQSWMGRLAVKSSKGRKTKTQGRKGLLEAWYARREGLRGARRDEENWVV